MTNKKRVLIADDNVQSAQLLSDELTQQGYLCVIAPNVNRTTDAVRSGEFDFVICDVQMGGLREFELLEQIRVLQPVLPIIVGSANDSVLEAVEADKHGAFQYFAKPFNIPELLVLLADASVDSQRILKTTPPPWHVPAVTNSDIVHVSIQDARAHGVDCTSSAL